MSETNVDVHFSSVDMTWETPQVFYDMLDEEYGFTLDPCCVPETAKCDTFFTPDDDGLSQDWGGHTVFMNPPYGREIGPWMEKAAQEGSKTDTKVVCLVPARTDTAWWQDTVFSYNADVFFVRGRLKFGNAVNSAPFPSAVVVFDKGLNSFEWGTMRSIGRE